MFGKKAVGNVGTYRPAITTEVCLRRGAKTHFRRNSQRPFRKEFLFAAEKPVATGREFGGKGVNGPSQRKTWLGGEVDGVGPSLLTASQDAPNGTEPDVDDTLHRVDYLESLAVGDDMRDSCVLRALRKSELYLAPDNTSIIVDSGAPSSACSVEIIDLYYPEVRAELLPSGKKFRRGDIRVFAILGSVVFLG